MNEQISKTSLPRRSRSLGLRGGNYVFVDGATGAVYFWDHEQPTPPVQMASDFAAFMEMLEPFDPGSIKLKPGQVKTAWIDPDFLKSLGR